MRYINKNKNLRLLNVLVSVLSLLAATLACGERLESIDSNIIAAHDLSGIDLHGKAMNRIDFSEKLMVGVKMYSAEIIEANFTNTDLRDADLSDTFANRAIFNGADLRGAKLDRFCFQGASWDGAKLDLRWQEVVFQLEEKLRPNQDLSGLNLSKLCLYSYDLRDVILYKADLSESQLSWANLAGANLQDVNLNDARLGNTNLAGANLTGANVTEEQLADTVLCKTILPNGQIANDRCNLLPASPAP